MTSTACYKCGRESNGNFRCSSCSRFQSKRKRDSYALRKEQGVCVKCKGSLEGSTSSVMCIKHLEYNRQKYKEWAARQAEIRKDSQTT